MQINVSYDASVANAPSGFVAAIQQVVSLYESLFTNNVTINIDVGWGEVRGTPISSNAAESRSNFFNTDYATVRGALINNAQSSVQLEADNTLPSVAQAQFGTGTSIGLTTANAKALGLIDPQGAAVDGYIGFNSSLAWSFDPNSTPVGERDFMAAAEHEISEVMGRASSAGRAQPGNNPTWRPMDFFRFDGQGQRDLSAGAPNSGSTAYFSIDNGQTSLGTWNNDPANGDLGDWQYRNGPGPNGNDAFGSSGPGRTDPLTLSDLTLMNVIGWNTAQDPATTVPNGVLDWVASGQSAHGMTVLSGGRQEVAGTASNTVLAGGSQQIDGGGLALATKVEGGGTEYVDFGATARGTTIEAGGTVNVDAGVTSGAVIDGGGEDVRGSYSLLVVGGRVIEGVARQSTINSGSEIIETGGNAVATTIGNGTLEVLSGGGLTSLELTFFGLTPAGPTPQEKYLPSVTFAAGGTGTLRLDDSVDLLKPDAAFAPGIHQPAGRPSTGLVPNVVTVAGFGGSDRIDFSDIGDGSHTAVGFVEAADRAYGTLSISDGTHLSQLLLIGQYTAASFAATSDGHGGTLITDPPIQGLSMVAPAHA
jgi:autotransporter passenger strand-loop-strand repeat protein